MFKQKEDWVHYLGNAVFVILFFLFLHAFAQNVEKKVNVDFPYTFASEIQSNAAAVIVDEQQVHFRDNPVSSSDKSNFKLLHQGCELILANAAFHYRFRVLQQAGISIKPVILHRFFRQYHSIDTDDLPGLS